jgi:hypothetical protein
MNYDTMSARELLSEYIWQAGHVIGASERMPIIWDAFRKAVIRESSVGEIIIEQHEGYMSPEPMFTILTTGFGSTLKAGTFYIVPKETL